MSEPVSYPPSSDCQTRVSEFAHRFKKINGYYRRGFFEVRIDPHSYDAVEAQTVSGITLQTAAKALSEAALDLWISEKLAVEQFEEVLSGIIVSYEIQDYFLDVPEQLQQFLEELSIDLLSRPAERFEQTIIEICRSHIIYSGEVSIGRNDQKKLYNDFLLLVLCHINTSYRLHSPAAYTDALSKLAKVDDLIGVLEGIKGRKSHGLSGLQRYLLGRIWFGLGLFDSADAAFQQSAEFYSERIKLKTAANRYPTNEVEETTLLALRRSTLARCLGSAYLYFVQGKLRKAIDLLDMGVPLLTLDCGQIIAAYCNLISASAKRALHSGDMEELNKCEETVNHCLAIFRNYVQESHYPMRCRLEQVLIKYYQAKTLFHSKSHLDREQVKAVIMSAYEEIFGWLNEVRHFASQTSATNEYTNPRLLIEALTLSSQMKRNRLSIAAKLGMPSVENAGEIIRECIYEAEQAIALAQSMKQQQCEGLIALGQAQHYQALLRIRHPTHPATSHEPDWRMEARATYRRALGVNDNQNPRITASLFLLLAKLEMEDQGNYLRARKHYEQYEHLEQLVEHQACRDLGKLLKKRLDQPYAEFFVDISSSSRLNLKYWTDQLEDFLTVHAMYRIARKHRGKLPIKDQKKPGESGEKGLGRETKHSILMHGLMIELDIKERRARNKADKRLEEFKAIAQQPPLETHEG